MKLSAAALLMFVIPLGSGAQPGDTFTPSSICARADSLRHAARFDSSSCYYQKAAGYFDSTQAWSKKAEALYKLSLNSSRMGNFEQAGAYIEEALALLGKKGIKNPGFQYKALYQQGNIAAGQAEYNRALKLYREALEGSPEDPLAVRLLIGIGDVYESQGKYEASIRQLAEAEERYHRQKVDDKSLLSSLYNSYGIAHKDRGNYQKALTYFRQSLDIDRQLLPRHHPGLAKTYNNVAIIYYYRSDYRRSLDYFKNAVNVLHHFYGKYHRLVAAGYNNVGIVYSEMDELTQAAKYLQKALQIKEKILDSDHPDIAIGYQNMGTIYYDMEQYGEALEYYKKSKALHLKRFPEGHPELGNVYANMGEAYMQLQQHEKALYYYQKDLDINRELLGDAHPFIGDTYTKIGQTYAMAGQYKAAATYFNRAIGVYVEEVSPENIQQSFPVEKVIYPAQLLETIRLKADALQKQADQTGEQQARKEAMQTYLLATQVIDNLQKSYRREGSKMLLRERSHEVFEQGFRTAYRLLNETGNSRYAEYAFYFAEESANQLLLERLQTMNAQSFAGVPRSLINKEQQIRGQLTELQQKLSARAGISQKQDSVAAAALRDSLFHARELLTSHIKKLEREYPKYFQLKYRPLVVRAADVQQQLLKPKQTMIRYFFGPESLYAFVISRDQVKLRKLAPRDKLQQETVTYRQAITNGTSAAAFADISYRLYSRLIEPLTGAITGRQLLVIPDGPLHYLPFESLITQNAAPPATGRYHKLPYLIQDFIVSYAPSAEYLHLDTGARQPKNRRAFVGFAPRFYGNKDAYPDYNRPLTTLPFNQKEVEEAGALFKNSNDSRQRRQPAADLCINRQATESAFKKLPADKYRYIHLATHAFVSDSSQRSSDAGILFSVSGDDGEDGTLHAAEIYDLQLRARLVTLSACQTGVGDIARGEGMMSLSRAFQYAGAQNLLVSLWDINDRSTARLMVDFYRSHRQNNPMPRALQQAKRNMIEGVRYAHPKYWAPFVLVGRSGIR